MATYRVGILRQSYAEIEVLAKGKEEAEKIALDHVEDGNFEDYWDKALDVKVVPRKKGAK